MTLPLDNITINAVAPSATDTPLIPRGYFDAILAEKLPVSSAETVALAMVFSATAEEGRKVEGYGKDFQDDMQGCNSGVNNRDGVAGHDEGSKKASVKGRWNGRVIFVLGDRYAEVEEKLADLKEEWLGRENLQLVRRQQALTDGRGRGSG